MALQMFSVDEAIDFLMEGNPDDEECLSEDELVSNFVTEGDESVVLFGDILSQLPATSVASLTSEDSATWTGTKQRWR